MEQAAILVVEDDQDYRSALSQMLELEGYSVREAQGGEEAYQVFKSEPVSFVITDIRMPDGDGVELLERIREHDSHHPAVLLVSGFSHHSRDEVMAKGALDFLDKSSDFQKILEYVNRHMRGGNPPSPAIG